jgi:hypothetical protein
MSLQQRWFHVLTAHQGIADASPVRRRNWARWLISAESSVSLWYCYSTISVMEACTIGMRRSTRRSLRSCPFRITGEPSAGMAIPFSTSPPVFLANSLYLCDDRHQRVDGTALSSHLRFWRGCAHLLPESTLPLVDCRSYSSLTVVGGRLRILRVLVEFSQLLARRHARYAAHILDHGSAGIGLGS